MISISAILTLAFALLSLVFLMVIHEFGHFIIAKKFGVRVDEFGIGYPPRICGKKIGETIYSINWLPLGAFVRIYGEEGGVDDYRSFVGLKIWKRVLIIIGGVAAFWLAAIIIFSALFIIGAKIPIGDNEVQGLTDAKVTIVEVMSNSAAAKAGLKMGDAVNEIKTNEGQTQITKISEFKEITSANKGKEITLVVERDGQSVNLLLTPSAEGESPVGVGLQRMATLIQKYPWYEAPIQGTIYTWKTTVSTVTGLYTIFANLLTGKGTAGAEFAGPLGITVFIANAATYGIGFFLYFIGTISVAVAVFNLFPIPALDGGKLVFLLIEKIKGKPVSVQVEQTITTVCFFLLIIMSIFITIRFDIPRVTDYFKSELSQK